MFVIFIVVFYRKYGDLGVDGVAVCTAIVYVVVSKGGLELSYLGFPGQRWLEFDPIRMYDLGGNFCFGIRPQAVIRDFWTNQVEASLFKQQVCCAGSVMFECIRNGRYRFFESSQLNMGKRVGCFVFHVGEVGVDVG